MIKKILPFILTLLTVYFLSILPSLSKAATSVRINELDRTLCAHSECLGNMCIVVSGDGPDNCIYDSDCRGIIEPPPTLEPGINPPISGITLPPVSSGPSPIPIIPGPLPTFVPGDGGRGGGIIATTEPPVKLTGYNAPPQETEEVTPGSGGDIDQEGVGGSDNKGSVIIPGGGTNTKLLPFQPKWLPNIIKPFVSQVIAESLLPIEIPLPSNGYDNPSGYTYYPYTQCQDNKCVVVSDSCGQDQCNSDADCGLNQSRYRICRNLRCIEVLGEGPDTCNLDNDCGIYYTCDPNIHMCYQDLNGNYTNPDDCFNDCSLTPPSSKEPSYPPPSTPEGDDDHDSPSPSVTVTPPITSGICSLNEFSLNGQDNTIQDPLINVSRAPVKLVFQTNSDADCESCQLTCSPSSCGLDSGLLGNISKPFNKEYSFRLPRVTSPQYYTYTLECQGLSGNSVSKIINLKVLPMFNWREINPGSF